MGLRKPKERMKFDQPYMSEKVTRNFKVFTGYARKLLFIVLDSQVSERLYRGPGFYYNYLIDYLATGDVIM